MLFAASGANVGNLIKYSAYVPQIYAMDATAAVLITMKHAQPKRKAKNSPYIFWKYTYNPPVSGIIAASSAILNAPNNDMIPAPIQTAINNSGEPSWAAIVAGFIKIPDPITLPMIIETDVHRPKEGFSFIEEQCSIKF